MHFLGKLKKVIKGLLSQIKFINEIRNNFLYNFFEKTETLINDKNKIYIEIFLYIFLVFILINFIMHMWYSWDILKVIIFFIWLYITYFIILTMTIFNIEVNKINDKKYIRYTIIFFWLNISCAFFLFDHIWSNLFYDLFFLIEQYIKIYRDKWK
jgi:hypothetical protein